MQAVYVKILDGHVYVFFCKVLFDVWRIRIFEEDSFAIVRVIWTKTELPLKSGYFCAIGAVGWWFCMIWSRFSITPTCPGDA